MLEITAIQREVEKELQETSVVDGGTILRLRQLQASVSRPGEDIVAELVCLFKRDSNAHLERIQEAYDRGDLILAVSSAHALKGASVAVGASRVAQICAWLEAQVKSGRSNEVLEAALVLEDELKNALSALEQIVLEEA